jgi:hypothetical protein
MIDSLNRRLYQDFGMKELIERFYNRIRKGDLHPVPYREIILTARIMDEVFTEIYPSAARPRKLQSNIRKRLFLSDLSRSTSRL